MGVRGLGAYISQPIQTATGSLSGAKFTALASIPAAAGVIPAANLPAASSGGWVLQGTVQVVSNAANVTFSALPSHKAWLIVFNLTARTSTDTIAMQLNTDTGNNYNYYAVLGVSFSRSTSQPGIILSNDTASGFTCLGSALIQGQCAAGNPLTVVAQAICGEAGSNHASCALGGCWVQTGTDTALSQILIKGGVGNIDGTVALYYNTDMG